MSGPHGSPGARWFTDARRRGVLLAVVLAAGVGCGGPSSPPQAVTLATTTSTQDSGLLDDLLPAFRRQTGVEVRVVAVGTGQALELGRRGDADVLLVHDPAAEEQFMAAGHGSDRRPVMHNEFVLAGPPADPAGAGRVSGVVEAFRRIADARASFVSRADESGTHRKEQSIWRTAGVEPAGDWYVRAGTGMAQALRVAHEKRAYVLTDRATYLALRHDLDLAVVGRGDPLLVNRYAVIVVNLARHPHVRADAARRFADYLVSPEGRQRIADFGRDKYGEPLFTPEVGPE
jgi:tungstate transport system substrate-binding protein